MSDDVKPALTREQWAKQLGNTAGNKRGGESEIGLGVYAYLRDGEQAERWEKANDSINYGGTTRPHLVLQWDTVNEAEALFGRHRLAALCLHSQPFGFTRADVDELRALALDWEGEAQASDAENRQTTNDEDRRMWGKNAESCRRRGAVASSLASRIAALLPPETP